jgi:hypothetical protein
MSIKLNYYSTRAEKDAFRASGHAPSPTEFLRDGPVFGGAASQGKKRISAESVRRRTEAVLEDKAERYFRQIRDFDRSLRFERFKLVRIISEAPHLGYSAITSGVCSDIQGRGVNWVAFFANFDCIFGKGDALFENIPTQYGLTYFSLALKLDDDNQVTGPDSVFHGNGLIFSTHSPDEALNNIIRLKRLPVAHAKNMAT